KESATKVEDKAQIANVAAISAADPEIGNLIADVMDKVGKDGVITVEESKGLQFETEYVEGMQFDRGYISAYFITNAERMEAELSELRGTFNVLGIKAPGFGDRRKEMLRDIAILTGGQVITEEMGRKLETVTIADLGKARKITADKDETTIVEGKGNDKEIKGR